MKRLGVWGLVCLWLTGCQQTNVSPVARGESYFKGFGCVKCHGVGGQGGTYGPDLTYVGFRKSPEFLDRWLENPHQWKGTTVMPNFHLPKHVRQGIVEYLSTLKGQGFPKGSKPWERAEVAHDAVKKGEIIYNTVGCVTCHGQRGEGGYPNNNVVGGLIPALTKVKESYTKEELEEKIRKGVIPEPADAKAEPPLLHMPVWGEQLSHEEIDAVASYLFSLAPKSSEKEGDW